MVSRANRSDPPAAPSPVLTIEIPRFAEEGFYWRVPAGSRFHSWDSIECARAAEVGEPEGVRAIVFDVVVRDPRRVLRFCCDPLDGAALLARGLASALGGRCSKVLRDYAREGHMGLRVPDLELLAELWADLTADRGDEGSTQ